MAAPRWRLSAPRAPRAPRAPLAILHVVVLSAAVARAALLVEPWGRDSLRVRVAPGAGVPADLPSALLPKPPPQQPFSPGFSVSAGGGDTNYSNGNLLLTISGARHSFSRASDGQPLLALEALAFLPPMDARHVLPQLSATFAVGASTVFGLGMQRQACYPEGGLQTAPLGRVFAPGAALVFDLARGEGGAANTLPWLMGATPGVGADWGMWLNVPAMGQATFDATADANRTVTWALAAAAQLDYIVTTYPAPAAEAADTPAVSAEAARAAAAAATEAAATAAAATVLAKMATAPAPISATAAFDILANFVSWVGTAPAPPAWSLAYWHSRNRYSSQDELLDAARGFYNRSVPVDIFVVDWLHWKVQGDWHFDPVAWPDPTAMVQELGAMGMRVMVTVWPWSHNGSLSYDTLLSSGWLVQAVAGTSTPNAGECPQGELCPPGVVTMPDGLHGSLVDVTNPAARDYVWSMVADGYLKHGIEVFWLDASEPEDFVFPQWGQVHWQNATFNNQTLFPDDGATFASMGQLFTNYWTQMFADNMRALGKPPVLLARASYAGAWRNGAAVWSGDIHCAWSVLQTQVRTGLSAQTSGFGLWTTDIGGSVHVCARPRRLPHRNLPGNHLLAPTFTARPQVLRRHRRHDVRPEQLYVPGACE
jgi:hypothetical protein